MEMEHEDSTKNGTPTETDPERVETNGSSDFPDPAKDEVMYDMLHVGFS